MAIFIIDTETTGLDPNIHCIWQIAGYLITDEGKILSVDYKCKPYNMDMVSDQIFDICHITREELESFPDAKQVYNHFRNFLATYSQPERLIWCGYNCQFDIKMMEAFFKHFDANDSIWKFFSHHTIDMYGWMKMLKYMGFINPESLKLGTAYRMFGVNEDTAHDALADVRVTYMLYEWAKSVIQKGLKGE